MKPSIDLIQAIDLKRGFTFLELLIVLAIIGVLVAISLPAYLNYTIRAQVIESLTLTQGVRTSIANYYKYTGTFPHDNFASGVPAADDISGNHIKSVTIENGAIQVLFDDDEPSLAGKIVSLRPVYTPNVPTSPIYFACGYALPSQKQKVVGNNLTNVPEVWLPSACLNH